MHQRNVSRRESPQHVEVTLRDGTSHHLSPRALDILLEGDHILKFRRSNGWATVGADPIRAKRRSDLCILYYGPERRIHD
jgi:hypothetical protein